MIFVLSFIYNRQIAVNGYYSENIGGTAETPRSDLGGTDVDDRRRQNRSDGIEEPSA
ncbi:hypothetical protein N183_25035 [Sinorhizobium sp. Sb3]|nr:hypothetical protein N183_25035 [Sinorhizobium sp. Sb3]